jgi:type I restriction enzyme S subunit
LGDACKITTGKKDVNEGNPTGQYPFFTCARNHTYSDHYSFDCEAILVAGNGEVGNLNYFSGKFEAYQRTYVLYDFTEITSYIWQQLSAHLTDSLGIGKIGSSIPYIKKGNLTNFEFRCPVELEEQALIATILSDMDSELATLETRRDKARQLKQGMMQELLTGRIRLSQSSHEAKLC